MTIGLSTYALTWHLTGRAGPPMTAPQMVAHAAGLGATVLQLCDYPPVETMADDELAELRAVAAGHGVTLELGTRGVRPEQLARYLALATKLRAPFVRTMLATADDSPSVGEAAEYLSAHVPAYRDNGTVLGLETYELVSTDDLLRIVEEIGDTTLGICLDPANSVARLEFPADVVRRTAPYVVNLHVKDFAFRRQPGLVGFRLEGAPLGEGLLDYPGIARALGPRAHEITHVVEHWVPWHGSAEATCRAEQTWTRRSIDLMRRMGWDTT
jgi:3-oxoisoapionate decarboxylase